MCVFISGGCGAGHQCSLPEVSQEAQRHDELLVQHAQRWCKSYKSVLSTLGIWLFEFSCVFVFFYNRYRICILQWVTVIIFFCKPLLSLQGGFEYKRAIVDCIISIIEENPESKETGLAHLCEFIEDCEHTVLATKILHLMGKEGPRTPQPSKYIRFIFNRVVLESEAVRAGETSRRACTPEVWP